MRRDMDLIRSLLLEIEEGRRVFKTLSKDTAEIIGVNPAEALPEAEAERLKYHLFLLSDAGFVTFTQHSGGLWQVGHITWTGQEFLSAIRDPEIWRQTKAGAAKVGSFSIKTIADIAVAIAKSRLEQLLATGQIGG